MAPSPEYDKEPKAPDKSATNLSSEDSKLLNNLSNDQHNSSDHATTTNSTGNSEVENNKHVETLDDEKLRALLDEAITYKCPKDREGKSSLFKELLEEVEQDEQACEAAARVAAGGRGWRRSARSGRRALQHSNSLQDLVAALAAEPAPRKHHAKHHHHHTPPTSVSARAIHGGSLPSGVDTSSLLSEEGGGRGCGAGYLATVRCVNPPPLNERRVSASDANAPHELDVLNRRSKPTFPMTYTARATLEIGSGAVCSGRAVTTTTASNQVDAGIPFSCITTPEVVASCTTTPSTNHASLALEAKPLQLCSAYRAVASLTGAPPAAPPPAATHSQPRSVIASSFNGLPLSRPNYGSTATTANEEFKKSLDENGNAVQGYSSPLSGSSQHKKPRRKKSSKNETVIDCRQLDGYQGDKDVNELLRFIESNAESRVPKLRAKHKDDADDKGGKKRSAERRKDKEKVKRASSLEERSRTKLEDLTATRPAPPPAKPERRSWGDAAPDDPPAPLEHNDFQTVTKKRKPRRRTDDPPRRAQPAPPSDRSNDSNDDMDSVHSLPEPRAPPPAPPAPPPPPAAHASYADIARTRHNIPDLIESCNFYAEGEAAPPPAPAPPDTDLYPALETRTGTEPPSTEAAAAAAAKRARDAKQAIVVRRDRKERVGVAAPGGVPAECPAPDVVSDRRPPVILLDSASRPRDMDGVTFGFDINEQLLGGGGRRPRCDLVRDAVEGGCVAVRAGCAALRYLPPAHTTDTHHLHQIVQYVGGAWEDVVRCGTGKVRYFAE